MNQGGVIKHFATQPTPPFSSFLLWQVLFWEFCHFFQLFDPKWKKQGEFMAMIFHNISMA